MKGNIARQIAKWILILFSAICAVAVCAALYAVYIYPHHIIRVRTDSPLRSVITPGGYDYNDTEIRTAILEHLPIGAKPQQIREFLTRHFSDVPYSVRSSSASGRIYKPKEPHVLIRAIEIGNLAGGETVELFLILDKSECLKDIIVRSHRVYL